MRIIFARREGLLVEENALSHVTHLPRKMIGGCNVKMAEGIDLIGLRWLERIFEYGDDRKRDVGAICRSSRNGGSSH